MKKIIETSKAPAPVGPYNQAIEVNGLVFVSGQIALDPESGDLIASSIQDETHKVFSNIIAILQKADLTLENVVKCTVFVSDIKQYGAINAVYSQYFQEETAPARELVQVSALPKGVSIEISVIAART